MSPEPHLPQILFDHLGLVSLFDTREGGGMLYDPPCAELHIRWREQATSVNPPRRDRKPLHLGLSPGIPYTPAGMTSPQDNENGSSPLPRRVLWGFQLDVGAGRDDRHRAGTDRDPLRGNAGVQQHALRPCGGLGTERAGTNVAAARCKGLATRRGLRFGRGARCAPTGRAP